MAVAALEREAVRALRASFLAALDDTSRDEFLDRTSMLDVDAGRVCIRPDGTSRGAVVIRGVFRVFVMAADGRRLTVRYARQGAMVGLVSGLGEMPAPVFVQAVTDGRLLSLDRADVEALARRNGSVAWALAREVSMRLRESIEALADASFGTLRSRVVRVLFDHASHDAGELIARMTQQEIADHLGTAREVVARNLAQLQAVELVRLARGAITIVDADRLARTGGGWSGGPYWTPGSPASLEG